MSNKNTQLPVEYNPIGCQHKLANGFSSWVFQSEYSGSGPDMDECVRVFVCLNCGEMRISGHKWDGISNHKDRFDEILHVYHPDAIDAIIKQANFFNEEAKWSRMDSSATEYATKLHLLQQENENMKAMAVQWRPFLEEVISKHESGLLPDRFIYDKIKKFLYGE